MSTKFECSAPNCPIKSIEQTIVDIKKNQDRFDEKQDAMLVILSEQKALSVDLENLKKTVGEVKENIKLSSEENKNTHISLFEKVNKLEQGKEDKGEAKQVGIWVWGLLIIAINFLLQFLQNILLGKGK